MWQSAKRRGEKVLKKLNYESRWFSCEEEQEGEEMSVSSSGCARWGQGCQVCTLSFGAVTWESHPGFLSVTPAAILLSPGEYTELR